MILPKILYDKFPSFTWKHDELFSEEKFISWQQDYIRWVNAKTTKAKKKIAQKWAIEPKKSTYKKKRK